MAVELVDDRKQRNRRIEANLVRDAAIVVAVPPLVLALVAGAATRNVLVALIVLIVVAGAFAVWSFTTLSGFGAGLLARSGSSTVTESAQPRLHNLIDGLCVGAGVAAPTLVGIDGPGRNIAPVTVGWGASSSNALIVSTPLIDALSRIELEGVIAQQLSQFQDGSSSLNTLVAAIRSTQPFAAVLGGRLDAAVDPDQQVLADVAGVHLTRYPPGLASALDTIGAGSTEIAGADATSAHLRFADPLGAGSVPVDGAPSLEIRAATLREL